MDPCGLVQIIIFPPQRPHGQVDKENINLNLLQKFRLEKIEAWLAESSGWIATIVIYLE